MLFISYITFPILFRPLPDIFFCGIPNLPAGRTMFFSSLDTHIFGHCILLLISYAVSHNIGPMSKVYTWLFQCFGYLLGPSSGTLALSPGSAQYPSKRRLRTHNLTPHLNSLHSRRVHYRYQPPPPYRPLPAGVKSKSSQPPEAPISTPTHTITLVKVPLPTRHSIGVPRFDPADVKSLAEYFEDFEFLVTGAQLSDAEKVKYSH